VVGFAIRFCEVVAQFMATGGLMDAVGAAVFTGTDTVATLVEVHPATVTAREKGPGPFTVGLALVFPLTMPVPLHE
jgi:hypothetical protein